MSVRWGIIGCGDVCEVKSGPAFQKASGSELVAVMRRDATKAADYARRHGVPRWYSDVDALISDPAVNAIYVATPPGAHEEMALKVAAAGKPCYVEKPMARNFAECERMIAAFREAKQPLYVAYYRRRLPRFLKAKEIIDSGSLGTITGMVYRHTRLFRASQGDEWRLDPAHSGGGLLLDLGSHAIDVFDFLLGPLRDLSGIATRTSEGKSEDTVVMSFRTDAGALGTASWNFAGATKNDVLEVDGTKARLVLTCFGDDPVRLEWPDGRVERFDLPNPTHIQQPFIQEMVNQISRGITVGNAESAARTSRVIDTVLESFYGSRTDGFWRGLKHGPRATSSL